MAAGADDASAIAAQLLESKVDVSQKWSATSHKGAEPFFIYLNAALAKTDSLSAVNTHELDPAAVYARFEITSPSLPAGK